MIGPVFTTSEVAEKLRCSGRKVREVAREINVGVDLRGRAGFRFSEADVEALWESMRPVRQVASRRRRRAN